MEINVDILFNRNLCFAIFFGIRTIKMWLSLLVPAAEIAVCTTYGCFTLLYLFHLPKFPYINQGYVALALQISIHITDSQIMTLP